jgi:hypothetical protein
MAWTRKQGNNTSSTGNIGSLAFTTQNNTSGSLLVCFLLYLVSASVSSGDVTVNDTTNGNWTKAYSSWDNLYSTYGVSIYSGIFYAPSNGNSAGKVSVGISGYAASNIECAVIIEEFTGQLTSGPLDVANGNVPAYSSGGPQTINGPTLTTNANGDLILVAAFDSQGDTTAWAQGTGFSLLQSATSGSCYYADEWETQSGSGAITPTILMTTGAGDSGSAFMMAAAFKAVASGGTTVSINHATMGFTGCASHANEIDTIGHASLGFMGQALHVNQAIVIAHAALAFAGQALHINQAILIARAVLTFSGKSLTALGATVVSISHAVMGFTGNSLNGIEGLIFAIKRVYLNVWSMWTGNPKSRGM